MPNGGSDCCGTCWFNRANRGERGYARRDDSIEPHCEIRDQAIPDPFWTYCANHPHRRPDRDPIPIGPIMVNASGGLDNDREVWKPSPDSEEIRRHLLDLLEDIFTHMKADRYPIGPGVAEAVMAHLGEFREERAAPRLELIVESCPDFIAEPAQDALDRIRGVQPPSDGVWDETSGMAYRIFQAHQKDKPE